mgnify:CR=1 FL=1
MGKPISFEKAYNIIMKTPVSPKTERINFYDSLNRVLAEDLISDTDMPPFDKSAMDGYVCKYEDLDRELKVIEEINVKEPNILSL